MTKILTALLALLLGICLLIPAATSVSIGGGPIQTITTFAGVPNPHIRGLNCQECHWQAPPKVVTHKEPCAQCHLPATQQQMNDTRRDCRIICPRVFWDVDGRPYPFGSFRAP